MERLSHFFHNRSKKLAGATEVSGTSTLETSVNPPQTANSFRQFERFSDELGMQDGLPTVDQIHELFRLGKEVPVPDFSEHARVHREKNTPEWQEALQNAENAIRGIE